MQRVILPGEVGSVIEPRLTVDGLRDFIQALRLGGQRIPKIILVSEYDRRDVNQDLLGSSTQEVAKEDQTPEHDGRAIGIIEGVMIRSSAEIARGKARLLYGPQVEAHKEPEGLIIVGA